ncbi:PREDICTED: uncharacterized protein LOC106323123 [Brassica oleracea var. oleracea]|uniref:uncharacterized protein LOC106323123 n=1 Tax=Brassica oleracea var. oleracea TaxID=109376 RepID=UPI0006A6B0BA|nr:PREDICTED: uncharacterized protein LOC106323123 [Brassica oleracea var. oleracea]
MLLVYKCLIKRGGLVESDKPTDVRKGAMEAVDECGLRVTVGDVASRAGLKPKLRKRFKLLMGFSRYRMKVMCFMFSQGTIDLSWLPSRYGYRLNPFLTRLRVLT